MLVKQHRLPQMELKVYINKCMYINTSRGKVKCIMPFQQTKRTYLDDQSPGLVYAEQIQWALGSARKVWEKGVVHTLSSVCIRLYSFIIRHKTRCLFEVQRDDA